MALRMTRAASSRCWVSGSGRTKRIRSIAPEQNGGQFCQRFGIDAISLGEPAHRFGEVARLFGIDDRHGKAGRLQGTGDRAFVAAGGLHDHQTDTEGLQRRRQGGMTVAVISEAAGFQCATQHRTIEMGLRHINTDYH